MVVKEPQNPTAKNNEYFASRLKLVDKIENTPRIKQPMTFTIRMFIGNVPIAIVDETNLYLRNAPAKAPMPNNIISSPFIFSNHPSNFNSIDRHYQHSYRSGSGYSKANAIA